MVEKAAPFCCPSNLHNSISFYGNLEVPDAWIDLKGAPDTLKGRRITPRLQQENNITQNVCLFFFLHYLFKWRSIVV